MEKEIGEENTAYECDERVIKLRCQVECNRFSVFGFFENNLNRIIAGDEAHTLNVILLCCYRP